MISDSSLRRNNFSIFLESPDIGNTFCKGFGLIFFGDTFLISGVLSGFLIGASLEFLVDEIADFLIMKSLVFLTTVPPTFFVFAVTFKGPLRALSFLLG